MATSSKFNAPLKDALRLTSAQWVSLADREGGKWNLLATQRLTRPAQTQLLRMMSEASLDAWLCSVLNGRNSRSASLPAESGLSAARLWAFPVPHSTRMILVSAPQQTANDQRVWRMLASLLPDHAPTVIGQPLLPEILAGLPYDLPSSLERILAAFVQAVPCQCAWLALRRGDALDVQVDWNDAKSKGASYPIDSNPLLRRVNRTLAEVVAAEGQPEWEAIPASGKKRGARVWICLPLVIGQRQIGAVAMWRTKELSGVQWQTLRDLAAYVSSSVEVAVTFSEMSSHLRRLGMLNDFALTISSAQNLDQIARRVLTCWRAPSAPRWWRCPCSRWTTAWCVNSAAVSGASRSVSHPSKIIPSPLSCARRARRTRKMSPPAACLFCTRAPVRPWWFRFAIADRSSAS